jgi:hypothetical protein
LYESEASSKADYYSFYLFLTSGNCKGPNLPKLMEEDSSKANFPLARQKLREICGTRRFITAFTKADNFFPFLSLMNQVLTFPVYFLMNCFNIILPNISLGSADSIYNVEW